VQIGHIGSIEVVYPDQPEQAQILTTLDRETARIDALVEKKTRFIELLKEKRQALITHQGASPQREDEGFRR
jgi:type I restriction enzyme S subunit